MTYAVHIDQCIVFVEDSSYSIQELTPSTTNGQCAQCGTVENTVRNGMYLSNTFTQGSEIYVEE